MRKTFINVDQAKMSDKDEFFKIKEEKKKSDRVFFHLSTITLIVYVFIFISYFN